MIRSLFKLLFKSEFNELQDLKAKVNNLENQHSRFESEADRLNKISNQISRIIDLSDVSVDVHEYYRANSWAVISIQGESTDYIKFIDLRNQDVREIGSFLRKFERRTNIKIDASPMASKFLKIERKRI